MQIAANRFAENLSFLHLFNSSDYLSVRMFGKIAQ